MTKREILKIFGLFLLWVLFLQLIIIVASYFLPYQPSFPYASELNRYDLPTWLSKSANFDGVHYLTISEKGYLGTGLIQAFFPLYPLLMSFTGQITGNYLVGGIILSHIFALTCFFSFYYLVQLDYGKKTAFASLVILAFFVSSFYLRSIYNEGLFLTLIFMSLIAGKKRFYLLAGLFGALASATRIVGIFIWPSLLWLVFWQDRQRWSAYLLVSLSTLGLLSYMFYLNQQFADPLYFLHLQEQFGASRQSNLVPYPQVVYRYLKILVTVRPFDLKYYAYVQEFLLSLLALVGLGWASWQTWLNKNRLLFTPLIFALGAYFLPPLTGNFSSMPRYILVCFPLFVSLALLIENRPKLKFLYLTISSILLIINLILFSQGYWVA